MLDIYIFTGQSTAPDVFEEFGIPFIAPLLQFLVNLPADWLEVNDGYRIVDLPKLIEERGTYVLNLFDGMNCKDQDVTLLTLQKRDVRISIVEAKRSIIDIAVMIRQELRQNHPGVCILAPIKDLPF